MSDSICSPDVAIAPIPVRDLVSWTVFGALLIAALYFVGAEEGATSLIPGSVRARIPA